MNGLILTQSSARLTPPPRGLKLTLLVLLLGLASLREARAQPAPIPLQLALPPAIDPESGSLGGRDRAAQLEDHPDELPLLPLNQPRPQTGPRSVSAFIDKLSSKDAAFEVVVGQSRILTVKSDLTDGKSQPLIAVGDPSIIEFIVLDGRHLRISGLRFGVTDLSITTAAGETYNFEARVTLELGLLEGRLRALYPDASVRIGQLREHVVVEGEARSAAQVALIIQTISTYLTTTQTQSRATGGGGGGRPTLPYAGALGPPVAQLQPGVMSPASRPDDNPVGLVSPELGVPLQITGEPTTPGIINLLRVPTSQQVMLKVRVAELNRTALRNIGANFFGVDPKTGAIVGDQIAASVAGTGTVAAGGRRLLGAAATNVSPLGAQGGTTLFGIFQGSDFMFTLNALRQNGVLKILAEPNLVAMSGYQASFLAGGEFPVPIPQASGTGVAPTVTVRFKEFGVRLLFVPYVIDEETIRLTVSPEVSQIDFSIAVTLVSGGSPVPGLNVRRAQTTVELKQEQTLAMAGLMQLQLSGTTTRIPGLGDLPVLGPFFSNTTGQRVEKELIVLVTPYFVEGMNQDQVPAGPGDEVKEPNDLEFFLMNRIEGRTGRDVRSTTTWDDVFDIRHLIRMEKKYVSGPMGYSD